MTQFKDIQTKIKLFYGIFSGKIKRPGTHIEISRNNSKSINNILIIFPVNEDAFRVALYSFRTFVKNKDINYYFVINQIYKHHFSLPGYTFNFNKQKNKIKIDETFYDERIINKDFDFIIDLNNEFIYDICSMLNDMKGYYKVGFNHKYSDYFYNIQLEANILENSYNKIQEMIH